MKRIKERKNEIILPIILDSSCAINYIIGKLYVPW
jgi:hypothetical protein